MNRLLKLELEQTNNDCAFGHNTPTLQTRQTDRTTVR